MSNPLQLEVSDLRVEIAGHQGTVRPLDGVSLEIAPGEAVGPAPKVNGSLIGASLPHPATNGVTPMFCSALTVASPPLPR